ncbi:MAG: DUF2332 family protein [Paracoccaceae bacterium]
MPLRLLGGLHALVLTGACPELAACYPPNLCPGEEKLGAALDIALRDHTEVLLDWLEHAPQTNEVRRSAVMISRAPTGWRRNSASPISWCRRRRCAAGLNLMWDRFRLDLAWGVLGPRDSTVRLDPEWLGPPPPEGDVRIVDRRGVDIAPLDPHDEADALRLISYLWPDQPWRIERAKAAMAMCDAVVDSTSACTWLSQRLATPPRHHSPRHPHRRLAVFLRRDPARLPRADGRSRGPRHCRRAARAAVDGGRRPQGRGAPIELTIWPGNHKLNLGRVDFHGRWIDWNAPPEHSPRKKKEKP